MEKMTMPLDYIWEPVVLPGDPAGGDVEYTYTPTAIICHLGDANGGHYVCFRKNGDNWFLFDDANVGKIHLDDPLNLDDWAPLDEGGGSGSYKDFMKQNACVVSYRHIKNSANKKRENPEKNGLAAVSSDERRSYNSAGF